MNYVAISIDKFGNEGDARSREHIAPILCFTFLVTLMLRLHFLNCGVLSVCIVDKHKIRHITTIKL